MKLIADYAKKIDAISTLKPWDIGYYSEKLQEEKFGFDDETLRPYFPSNSVIKGDDLHSH